MSPMTFNGVSCQACGEEFKTVGEFEDHDCDGDVVRTFRGP